jgi:hypothetical protein
MDAQSNFSAKLSHRCVAIGTLTVKPPSPLRSGRKKEQTGTQQQLQQQPEDEAKAQRVEQKVSVTKESKRMANFCPLFFCQSDCLSVPQFLFSPPTLAVEDAALIWPVLFLRGPAEVILPVAQQQSKKITNQGVWRLAYWQSGHRRVGRSSTCTSLSVCVSANALEKR